MEISFPSFARILVEIMSKKRSLMILLVASLSSLRDRPFPFLLSILFVILVFSWMERVSGRCHYRVHWPKGQPEIVVNGIPVHGKRRSVLADVFALVFDFFIQLSSGKFIHSASWAWMADPRVFWIPRVVPTQLTWTTRTHEKKLTTKLVAFCFQ